MQITIEEATYYAVTDCRILAIQGEANTRSVHFTYPCGFRCRTVFSTGTAAGIPHL